MNELFTTILMEWYGSVERDLPWVGISDPYKIWLSEVILQQTRVEQGKPYYEKFVTKYPDIHSLASATEDQVLKDWQGLGYYSRARNLHAAAKKVVEDCGGDFPSSYKNIRALPGIGDYTAAAIASFAYGYPHAVVDGNVYRVLSRVFGIQEAVDHGPGKRLYADLADKLLLKEDPGTYNQAIMDFGATLCKPQNPTCEKCPLNAICIAFNQNRVTEYPVKVRKTTKRDRYFNFYILRSRKGLFMEKRIEKDIWQHLYQFPKIESKSKRVSKSKLDEAFLLKYGWELTTLDCQSSSWYSQTLSHQEVFARFHYMFYVKKDEISLQNCDMIRLDSLSDLAFPKVIADFIKENNKLIYE